MGLILFLGALFIGVGLLVTRKNASRMLRTQPGHDAGAEAVFFRRFHFFLGGSLLVIGLSLSLLVEKTAGMLFAVFYPLAAYLYYFARTVRRGPRGQSLGPTIGIIAIAGSVIGVLLLMRWGFSVNEIVLADDRMEITGPYGEVIRKGDIAALDVVDSLPDIKLKKNGFAVGRIAKGYFLLRGGETVKLIIDGESGPYLRIRRITGEVLYFQSPSRPAADWAADIRSFMPDVPPGE